MIFLSHNSKDKDAVRTLYNALKKRGIDCWFDEKDLEPGSAWQLELEKGISESKAMAVCLGPSGMGPWQEEEMWAALSLGVRGKKPVIPVLLPGVPGRPDVPLFLQSRTWVDLRPDFDEAALDRLAATVPKAKPEPDATSHLLIAELAEMRSMFAHLEGGRSPSGLKSYAVGMSEMRSASGTPLAQVIPQEIIEVVLENVAKARDRFVKALGDPANSQQAKDQEKEIAKSTICTELGRVKELNENKLPEVFDPDWRAFGCSS